MSKTESPIKLVCKYVDELALIEVDPFKNYRTGTYLPGGRLGIERN